MSKPTIEDLIDFGKDLADEAARCLWKYRRSHPSCVDCLSHSFCEQLNDWLEGEIQSSDKTGDKNGL